MMPMRRNRSTPDYPDPLVAIRNQAERGGLQVAGIDDGHGTLGLVVFSPGAGAGRVAGFHRAVGEGFTVRMPHPGPAPAAPQIRCDGLPVLLVAEVEAALQRSRRSLMPCCLTLIALDHGRKLTEPCIPADVARRLLPLIRERLHPEDDFHCLGAVQRGVVATLSLEEATARGCAGLAVLSHDTALRKARQRAERLRKSVKAAGGERNGLTMSIGVAMASPHETGLAEQLLARAEEQLRAARQAGDRVCAAGVEPTDLSCQVTVEERAQLFRFVQKGYGDD